VTPAAFYEDIHPVFTACCAGGVVQTRELLRHPAALYLGDSEFNSRELIALGAEESRVRTLPPFHDLETLFQLQADVEVLWYAEDDVRNILFVGRVAPNKGHLDLIDVFAAYHRTMNSQSRLFLVGDLDPRLETYTQQVCRAIEWAGLSDCVLLTGKATPAQLKGYYLTAHAFLCASRHEGFCVPLVEAMYFQVPCVAVAGTAVTCTLGKNALLWDHRDPSLLAESLHACVEDTAIREYVTTHQSARYRRQYAPAALERQFLHSLRPLLAKVAA
jgi:glycosyltransferase involved in cell wall biosynthesis